MTQLLDSASVTEQATALLATVDRYKAEGDFNSACTELQRFLQRYQPLLTAELRLRLTQQWALCTYKNAELPAERRLERALSLLQQADPLAQSNNTETLGLAGSIYKRQWRETGRRSGLEKALRWYRKGAELTTVHWHDKQAYCAINLAFLLEQYAHVLTLSGISDTAQIEHLRAEAGHWRARILQDSAQLVLQQQGNDRWWSLVTLAEAAFGQADFALAHRYFADARALKASQPWQLETLIRQLAELARVRWSEGETLQQARQVMADFVQQDIALESLCAGTFGLALSGGGMRAAFYHIGVLARLAERDLLRRVEVISCVSGGSVLGAAYYLELQHLLERKPDRDIHRDDYIALVQRLEKNMLAGVQTNIRQSIFSQPLKLLRMLGPGYSRTHRLAELYETRLYSRVQDGKGEQPRNLSQLLITPCDAPPEGFRPRDHNWTRRNKVPALILNATALNTGHSWQFTASWMGGAPWGVNTEVDSTGQLSWFYYSQAPALRYQQMSLGQAVAASSCVPGLFSPLVMDGLYQNMTVRLVDGGVYDNQGAAALLDRGCDHILISDASGQIAATTEGNSFEPSVVLRSNDIFQERLRNAQQKNLNGRYRNGLLKSLCHIHLKKGLSAPDYPLTNQSAPASQDEHICTDYGIHRAYQQALAEIRTDLDRFSDNEARALMYSGYQMTEHYLPTAMRDLGCAPTRSYRWGFLQLADPLGDMATDHNLLAELKAGRHRFFRRWQWRRQR